MKDFLKFKKILIPVIIPVLFRIGLYFSFIFGVYQIVRSYRLFGTEFWYGLLLLPIFWFVLIPVILRIICEVLIILSDMNDTLTDIKNQSKPQQDTDNQAMIGE